VEKLTGENYNSALTQKQRRVLELAMKGFSNLQIAELMGISKRTVAYHMKGIKSLIQPRKITGMVKGMDE
jgi:DNA-binding CsgD family transcriptional regulator